MNIQGLILLKSKLYRKTFGAKRLSDEITVKVQRMFPNCEKYKKCCTESKMEDLVSRANGIDIKKLLKDIEVEKIE